MISERHPFLLSNLLSPVETVQPIVCPAIKAVMPEPAGGLKLLVFGGRHHGDYRVVEAALDQLRETYTIGLVIHGGAPGVDGFARAWAQSRRIPVCSFPANWVHLGNAAGPIRNREMLEWGQPDFAAGFPGGDGTADMRRRIVSAGIRLIDCG